MKITEGVRSSKQEPFPRSSILHLRSSRGSRAFTLIELLVVLAVIALLAALLYPVLTQGRLRARQTQCQSNLRQLGHAFQMYAGDWDGLLPSPGGLYGERNYWDQGSGQGVDLYLRNRTGPGSVWTCPEVDLDTWSSGWEPRTYTMNSMLRDPPDVEPYTEANKIRDSIALEAIPEPAATVLLFEGTQSIDGDPNTGKGYIYRTGDWTNVRGYWRAPQDGYLIAHLPWHGMENNLLFVDGHVKAGRPDPREPNRPEQGRDLWRVHKR